MKKFIQTSLILLFLLTKAFGQGPVIVSGLDTEAGIRPVDNSHGTISMWANVIKTGILDNVISCGTLVNKNGNILVIGGGKGSFATDHMTNFWTQIGNSPNISKNITFVNGAANIINQSFVGYSMIVICNTVDGLGKLDNYEYGALISRKNDIAEFVNCGGGLFASACDLMTEYAYFNPGNKPFTVSQINQTFSTPTNEGISMGLGAVTGPFHVSFSQWPNFLQILATLNSGPNPVILGGRITLLPSCEASNSIGVGTGTMYPTSSHLQATFGSTILNKSIMVLGDFPINSNMTFNNCNITCLGGSSITNNSSLTINNSTLKTCSVLWKGIIVQDNKTLNISNTTIQDAHIAIEYKGKSNTTLINNTFRNNVIGIFYENKEVFSKNIPTNILRGNIFTSSTGTSTSLKMKYTNFVSNTKYNIQNNQPNTIPKPFAGIMVFDVDRFDIDNPITDPSNLFSNMTNGIITYNVMNTKINYCRFDNIKSIAGNTNLANGNGIYHKYKNRGTTNDYLAFVVTGKGKTASIADFNNTTLGIFSDGGGSANYEIKNNRMTGTTTGIDLIDAGWLTVDNNYIVATKYNIHANYLTICSNVSITNNDCILNGTANTSTGILLDNTYGECFHALNTIANNCINVKNTSGFGIDINNISNRGRPCMVTCNSIKLEKPTTNLGGIKSTNGYMNRMNDNYIYSTNRLSQNNNDFPVAIHINGSELSQAAYNRFNDIYTGYKFTGPCYKGDPFGVSLIYGTRFQNLNTAFKFDLILTLNDIAYDQYGFNGSTTPSLIAAYNMANEFNGTITTRAFSPNQFSSPKIRWSGLAKYSPIPCSPGISNQVAKPIYSPSTAPTCGTTICGNIPIYPRVPVGDIIRVSPISDVKLRNQILTKTLDFADYQPEMIWQMEYALYQDIKPYEATYADTTLEKQFIVEKDQENFREIYEMQQDQTQWTQTEDSSQYYLENTMLEIRHQIDSLSVALDIAEDSQKPAIQAQINAQIASMNTIQTQLSPLEDAIQAKRIEASNILTLRNDSLMATGKSDSLLKLFNSIYYKKYYVGDYQLTESQKSTLQFIANQCPFINFGIVHRARSAYRIYNDTLFYDDSVICAQVGIINKMAKQNEKANTPSYTLYPNPASDMVNIQLSEIPKTKLTVFITDIQGRVYHNDTREMISNSYEFSTQRWAEGIYMVQLYEGKKLLTSQQLRVKH